MFTSLEGSNIIVREVDVTTKAHQRHEGSLYSPFETTRRRRFSTSSGRPWGGLQTLTNFPVVITMVDSSPNDSYRLGVSNLQEYKIKGTAQNLLKSRIPLVERRRERRSIFSLEQHSRIRTNALGI